MSVAIYDALVAAWDSKYFYNRPGPAASDQTLQPVTKPADTPSHPSEHAVAAGAAAAVLSYLSPDSASAFQGMAQQAAQSRVIGGASFPSEAGRLAVGGPRSERRCSRTRKRMDRARRSPVHSHPL